MLMLLKPCRDPTPPPQYDLGTCRPRRVRLALIIEFRTHAATWQAHNLRRSAPSDSVYDVPVDEPQVCGTPSLSRTMPHG